MFMRQQTLQCRQRRPRRDRERARRGEAGVNEPLVVLPQLSRQLRQERVDPSGRLGTRPPWRPNAAARCQVRRPGRWRRTQRLRACSTQSLPCPRRSRHDRRVARRSAAPLPGAGQASRSVDPVPTRAARPTGEVNAAARVPRPRVRPLTTLRLWPRPAAPCRNLSCTRSHTRDIPMASPSIRTRRRPGAPRRWQRVRRPARRRPNLRW